MVLDDLAVTIDPPSSMLAAARTSASLPMSVRQPAEDDNNVRGRRATSLPARLSSGLSCGTRQERRLLANRIQPQDGRARLSAAARMAASSWAVAAGWSGILCLWGSITRSGL